MGKEESSASTPIAVGPVPAGHSAASERGVELQLACRREELSGPKSTPVSGGPQVIHKQYWFIITLVDRVDAQEPAAEPPLHSGMGEGTKCVRYFDKVWIVDRP
jgi:hypothetical protein